MCWRIKIILRYCRSRGHCVDSRWSFLFSNVRWSLTRCTWWQDWQFCCWQRIWCIIDSVRWSLQGRGGLEGFFRKIHLFSWRPQRKVGLCQGKKGVWSRQLKCYMHLNLYFFEPIFDLINFWTRQILFIYYHSLEEIVGPGCATNIFKSIIDTTPI